jgi:ABC-type polysaccharide/polyol phosphate transport system ATPase subunit
MSLRIASDSTHTTGLEPSTHAVVQLDHVSVRYRVPQERIGTFKEYAIRRLQGRVRVNEFWALRDVSLRVSPGEILGIVGRNGAGKTTLLKVIARVLRPTHGRVWVKGHLAPLLDLGAGFHPELTGRENVFLNGSLLGRTEREIHKRFAEILEFAGLPDFIDAPLRTYSSGMVARLGFAVATAWQPDILIIDELLAVGDEAFQDKCRARLEGFRNEGTTVLLVSHSAEMIRTMCRQAIWLDHGSVRAWGPADEVTQQYHAATGDSL